MIQVLNRALDIIEYVARNPKRDHTLSEIADHLELNHGTCANIMKTLVQRNYLEQVVKKKGYRLGNMAYYLTGNYSYKKELVEAAKMPMENLAKVTNEGCILSILRGNIRVIIHEEKSHQELQVINYPEKNAYATSTGRMILSYMSEEELKQFVKEYGLPPKEIWSEVTSWEDLIEETSKIRNKRISTQESRAHVIGIAIPIWRKGKVVAALGIYMPAVRLREDMRDEIFEQLKNTGDVINKNLSEMMDIHNVKTIEVNE